MAPRGTIESNALPVTLAKTLFWFPSRASMKSAATAYSPMILILPHFEGERQDRLYREGEAPAEPLPSSAGASRSQWNP